MFNGKGFFILTVILSVGLLYPLSIYGQHDSVGAGEVLQVPESVVPSNSTPSPAEVSGLSTKIDMLDLKNIDVVDVLKLISQKSGLNIVAGQNVTGKVTVYLKDLDVLEALKIIVDAYGWAYVQEGDVIKLMTAKEFEDKYEHKFGEEQQTRIKQLYHVAAKDVTVLLIQVKSPTGKIMSDDKSNTVILVDKPSKLEQMEDIIDMVDVSTETKVYELTYAKAEDIANKLNGVLTPVIGTIKFDERSNKIFISDIPNKIRDISEMIVAFDQKDRQVLIEAKIVQIALSDEQKLGIDWEGLVSNYHNLDLVSNFSVLNSSDKRGKISIGTLTEDKYTALIEALETIGTTRILSSPRISAVNNKEAKVLVGSTEPYVTSTTTTPASGPTTTAENVQFIEVGVKLFVTPQIHNDGFITMKIKPEVSSVVKTITTATNNAIPVVETSEAETTVVIKDGVTLVIGGLIKDEKVLETKRVPLLGKIPILGAAFRSQNDQVSKTEIAIFLTPKIITGDVDQESYPLLSEM